MCGICGIYSQNIDNEKQRFSIEKMNESQSNRGPDGDGVFFDHKSGISLGHKRLSILDLSIAGKQPMISNDGKFIITFNGEIYNFKELRLDLEKIGYSFKTATDTEVILLLYKEFGAKSFEKLSGMFAFGLWDSVEKKLFLVKDRYGIKPLYYYKDKDKLIFASTVKAIEKSTLIYKEKNPEALVGFLLFGSVPLPYTTLKNVFGIMPGHYLVISQDGKIDTVKYYDPINFFKNKLNDSYERAVGKIKTLISDSVRLHLRSDVPTGVFLSGGLDSGVIAISAAQQTDRSVETLSVVFDEKEFSEKKYQRLIAEQIKNKHHEIKITKKNFTESLEDILRSMDQPSIDGINTYFISKAARKVGIKVVLSGLGADEIFCGYSKFNKATLLRTIQKMPKPFRFMISLISLLGGRYKKLIYLKKTDPLRFYLSIRSLFVPKEISKILGISINKVEEFIDTISIIYNLENTKNLDPIDLLSYLELKFYLQNQLLKDTDFMSMRHGVEVRVPFLDNKLVEYLSSLPTELKTNNAIQKVLLVETILDVLPQEIWNRPKMGFTFPLKSWLQKADVSKFLANLVLSDYK